MEHPRASGPPGLLAIVELGGYPNLAPVYEQAGYAVEVATSMRKALAALKRSDPAVIVAEFNYQSDFRDRTSSLESLLAVLQRRPGTRVIVFYEPEYRHQFERLRARFPIAAALPFPIEAAAVGEVLREVAGRG